MTEIATKPWYDTREGFENALQQGLAGLKEISDRRACAGYKDKERLSVWYILGYYCFDACGNTMVITEGHPTYSDFNAYVPRILTDDEMRAAMKDKSWTMTHGSIPPTSETCPRCLEGWNMQNYATHMAKRDYQTDEWTHYHKRCHDLKVTQSEIAYFREILKEAHLDDCDYRLIPAEYPDRPTAPWFMVETDLGPIKIGYRRRVISISWKHAEGLKEIDGRKLFEDEGVTTDRALVHAWGKDKAVDYLNRLVWPVTP